MKKELIDLFVSYANCISETTEYKGWSNEFCRSKIKDANDQFVKLLGEHIDFDNLTVEEYFELGFIKYDMCSKKIMLIPLYLLPVLPIGIEVICISGRHIKYDGSNLDNETRGGCIAYGIELKSIKES